MFLATRSLLAVIRLDEAESAARGEPVGETLIVTPFWTYRVRDGVLRTRPTPPTLTLRILRRRLVAWLRGLRRKRTR